jgi:prepilin-type N-terminal cleavage/methylation domain-containing protein/prepilin-type processing-associated H-X9-DG protein
MTRRAFTLIELLVVIAIIAILAAILFPVFAQAKAAAKKTADLSNVKQIGTGMQLYVGDYDDTTPTILGPRGSNTSYQIDWYTQLFPYVKSMDMFFSPTRPKEYTFANGDNCDDSHDGERFNKKDQCIGYGYNWAFSSAQGSGLLYGRENDANWRINRGKNLSVIEKPAQMFAFGDTGDSPRYTICMNYIVQYYPLAKSSLQNNGRYNMAFVDGHAKSVMYGIGSNPLSGDPVAMPMRLDDAKMYCDTESTLESSFGMGCADTVSYLYGLTSFLP